MRWHDDKEQARNTLRRMKVGECFHSRLTLAHFDTPEWPRADDHVSTRLERAKLWANGYSCTVMENVETGFLVFDKIYKD